MVARRILCRVFHPHTRRLLPWERRRANIQPYCAPPPAGHDWPSGRELVAAMCAYVAA